MPMPLPGTKPYGTASALAGSDHHGSNSASQPVDSVDHAVTGSVKTMAGHKAVDTTMKVATNWPDPGQGIWGN